MSRWICSPARRRRPDSSLGKFLAGWDAGRLTDGQTPWPDARPACRTVVGLFPRQGANWNEEDPDHVPDAPPAWARVVDIG